MTMEEKDSIFDSIRNSIMLAGEDPNALGKGLKELSKLESKFVKYAKSMKEVLAVHAKMNTEMAELKETNIAQQNEILQAKDNAGKSEKTIIKLKRINQKLNKLNKKKKNVQIRKLAASKIESRENSSGSIVSEINKIKGETEYSTK